MQDRFTPHQNNPNILVGKTFKLKEPVSHYSWVDRRSEEEVLKDIEQRKTNRRQEILDLQLAEMFE